MSGATFYMAEAHLAESFARAPVGQAIQYATGPGLDPAHPTVRLAKQLVEQGQALTQIAGRDGDGQLRHVVRKREARPAEPEKRHTPLHDRLGVGPEFMDTVTGRVLALLVRQAEAGLPCPSDQAISDALGLSGRGAGQYQVALLVGMNLIESINPRHGTRVVRIIKTGQRTALPVGGV